MNDMNEAIWEEDGKDTPGVWNGHWQVGNARKIKFLSGEKQLWQPRSMRTILRLRPARALYPQPGRAEAFHRRGLRVQRRHLAQHRGPIPFSSDGG